MRGDTTPEQVLAVELGRNSADAATVGDYLIALLAQLWQQGRGFSSSEPFGDSGWQDELYLGLARAGLVEGEISDGHELDNLDESGAYLLIATAIEGLRPAGEYSRDDYEAGDLGSMAQPFET